MLSNICSAFNCTPDIALEQNPQLIMAILEYRNAIDAKDMFNKKATDMPQSLIKLWAEITGVMKEKGYLE